MTRLMTYFETDNAGPREQSRWFKKSHRDAGVRALFPPIIQSLIRRPAVSVCVEIPLSALFFCGYTFSLFPVAIISNGHRNEHWMTSDDVYIFRGKRLTIKQYLCICVLNFAWKCKNKKIYVRTRERLIN